MKREKIETIACVCGLIALLCLALLLHYRAERKHLAPAPIVAAPPSESNVTPAPLPFPEPAPAPIPETWEAAVQKAVETSSAGVALLTADWCVPCRHFERVLLPSLKDSGEFAPPWLCLIDVDKDKATADKLFGSDRHIPQLVKFEASSGTDNVISVKLVDRLVGPRSVEAVKAFLHPAIEPPKAAAEPVAACVPSASACPSDRQRRLSNLVPRRCR